MTSALITGANKGLGFETARRLAALGWTIHLGARDPELGKQAATELSEGGADVRFVELDVTSDESVSGAFDALEPLGALDVVVNNAGIVGTRLDPLEVRPQDFLECFGSTCSGPCG
jgi:NAD(P)-dependent dehydrogenase (short-subunit alcohol dehydrogenase family)